VTPECPRFETLAAYKENALRTDERASVEAHFVECEDCRKTVAFAVRAQMVTRHPEGEDDDEPQDD